MSNDPKVWQRRYEREKNARKQAEALLEQKSSQLYETNLKLEQKVQLETSKSEQELIKFTKLFQSSIDGIILYKTSGHIIDANQAFLSLLGLTETTIKQIHFSKFYPKSENTIFEKAHNDLLEQGSSRFEAKLKTSKNVLFPAEISTTKFKVNGNIIIQAIVRDVSEAKKQKEEFQQASEIALKASETKSLFLATMSHEIRTPLNGILGFTDILLGSKVTKEQEDHLNIIKKSGDILLNIINDILDFSRIESNLIELEQAHFNLIECIEETLDMQAQQAASKQVELLYFVDKKLPTNITGDIGRLRQVLLNLVSNGLKFTEKGTVSVNVNAPNPSFLQFTISDTGIGFDIKIKDQLFSAFQQADASTTRKYGGTGLGLAISKQLVEAMGGTITATSTKGKGSIFTFSIPLIVAPQKNTETTKNHSNFLPAHGLVIDDNLINLEIMQARLKQWKLTCDLVSSPHEALKILEKQLPKYNILFIDMLMPEINGIELASKIKQLYPNHPPMVMLTSSRIDGEKKLALQAGYYDIIYKPIREKELLNITLAALEQKIIQKTHTQIQQEKLQFQPFKNYFCLVTEDNAINAKLAKLILERLGFTVHIAHNGKEALTALKLKPIYHLIFMDMQMPIMDGIEATQKIRNGHTGKHYLNIPIIAMTANVKKQDEIKCLNAGMNDFISKPIQMDQLKKIITGIIK